MPHLLEKAALLGTELGEIGHDFSIVSLERRICSFGPLTTAAAAAAARLVETVSELIRWRSQVPPGRI